MKIHHFEIPKISQTRLIKAGYSSEEDFVGKTEDEIKACGVGEKGLYDLKNFLKHEFKIKLIKTKKKVVENHAACVEVIEHFLGKEDINWGREMRSANTLLKKHGLAFLLKIPPPPKIYSLGYFFQDFGVRWLSDKAPIRLAQEEKKEEVVEEIVERQYEPNFEKPKSIKDFLGIK